MNDALKQLTTLLRPVLLEPNIYRGIGSSNDGAQATYGGHFLGQASAAALQTVEDDRHLHSLHGYFVRGGTPGEPIDYYVERTRDGRTFCTRRVTAKQQGRILFEMLASFSKLQDGQSIKSEPPSDFTSLPAPDTLVTYKELMLQQDPLPLPEDWAMRDSGIDIRVVNAPWAARGPSEDNGIRAWIRADGNAEEDPKLHTAMLAYQTDESLADILLIPFNKTWCSEGTFCVSLDHALWFHQPVDLNAWHFIDQRVLTADNGRGVGNGYVWSQTGELVASFTQEVLFHI